MSKRSASETKNRIMTAAMDVFADVDFHQATVRDIAKKAGIAKATIYKYFESKEQLLNHIATDKMRQATRNMEKHLAGLRGTETKLRKMTWFYLDFFQQEPKLAWMIYASSSMRSWYLLSTGYDVAHTTGQIFRNILNDGKLAAEVREDIDIRLVMHGYFGILRHVIVDWLMSEKEHQISPYSDAITDLIFNPIRVVKDIAVPSGCPLLKK